MDAIGLKRLTRPSAVVSAGGASLGGGGSAGASLRPAEAQRAGEANGGSGVAAERRQGSREPISSQLPAGISSWSLLMHCNCRSAGILLGFFLLLF